MVLPMAKTKEWKENLLFSFLNSLTGILMGGEGKGRTADG
jgi:hypothetical protein